MMYSLSASSPSLKMVVSTVVFNSHDRAESFAHPFWQIFEERHLGEHVGDHTDAHSVRSTGSPAMSFTVNEQTAVVYGRTVASRLTRATNAASPT